MTVLRDGLLAGVAVALAGCEPRGTVAVELERLGATTYGLAPRSGDEPGEWAAEHGPLDALVFDAAAGFAAGGDQALMAMLEATWDAVLELASALIAAGRPGKLVLLAPTPGAGPLARAAADALENVARTLSIEWARHGITICAIAPGDATPLPQTAELIAYLLSPAGDYFTGCRLQLGAVS